MSKPSRWARWATCALALAIVTHSAAADGKKKKKRPARPSIAACTSFDQVDKADETVELVISNACDVAVSCSVSWTVTCAPDSKRKQRHHNGAAFALQTAQSQASVASAEVCGNDGWVIDDVVWQCQPVTPSAAE